MKNALIFLMFILLLLCSSGLHASSDKYSGFPDPQADFQAHIQEVKSYLLDTQMSQRQPSDVQFNLPYEKKANPTVPYRGKFLLFHGLNDSPYIMTDVATELVSRGFDVRAILLPGHGNSPEAQLKMSYTRWIKAARNHLHFWRTEEKVPIYLAGFSLGGVLATLMALENDDISGLLLFSPAYKSSMNHLLRWSSIYSVFKPWIFGGMIIEDNPTKYNSIPVNGATQYYKTTRFLKKKWRRKQIDIPVLITASRDDSVVDVDHLINTYESKFSSENKRFILYSNHEEANLSPNVEVRPSAYPELRILNQSHQSGLLSPKNALFGVGGTQLVCNGNDWPTFSGCLYFGGQHWYGAQHTESPDGTPVARSTFNPDFDNVFAVFDEVFLN